MTKDDYIARLLNLPAKCGNIAKAYVERAEDRNTLRIRTLSYNQNRQLVQTPLLVFNNLLVDYSKNNIFVFSEGFAPRFLNFLLFLKTFSLLLQD